LKIADLSNSDLITEILRPILAEFYPDLEPFTLDEVKQLLKERTGKEVEDAGAWVEWYMECYPITPREKMNVAFSKYLYDMRKELNADLIKRGKKPLDEYIIKTPPISKIIELSNQYLVIELMRPIIAQIFPEAEPFTLDEVKKILEERTGKKVEGINDWIEWYIESYHPIHEPELDISGITHHYNSRKQYNARLIKDGLKPLDD
jgi:hypothetical protein